MTTPPASTEPPDPDASSTTQPAETGVIAPGLEPLVEIAIADLASKLDIAQGDITVVSAEMVVWPDSSLGCPQPGMAYTQVLVDGFRIVLSARGEQHAYHGGGAKEPFLCESPQP